MVPLMDASGNSVPTYRVSTAWISEAFQLFQNKALLWIAAFLVGMLVPYGILFLLLSLIGYPVIPTPTATPVPTNPFHGVNMTEFFLVEIVSGLVFLFFFGGLLTMAVKQVRGLPIQFRDLFSGTHCYFRLLGYNILYNLIGLAVELICFAPFLLLISSHASASGRIGFSLGLMNNDIFAYPLWFGVGLLVFMLISLFLFGLLIPGQALVADGEQVLPALKRSFGAMKSQWLATGGLMVLTMLLMVASEIPCGLGLFVTVPMMLLMIALSYRDMIGMPHMVPPQTPFYGMPSPGVWPPPPGEGPSAPPPIGTV